MRTIPVKIPFFGNTRMGLLALCAIVVGVAAVAELGPLLFVAWVLHRAARVVLVPLALFAVPSLILAPFVFAYHATAGDLPVRRANNFALGVGLSVAGIALAIPVSAARLGAPASFTAPTAFWIFAAGFGGAVTSFAARAALLARLRSRGR